MKSLVFLTVLLLGHCATKSLKHEGLHLPKGKVLTGVISKETGNRFDKAVAPLLVSLAANNISNVLEILKDLERTNNTKILFKELFAQKGHIVNIKQEFSQWALAAPDIDEALNFDGFDYYDALQANYIIAFEKGTAKLKVILMKEKSGQIKIHSFIMGLPNQKPLIILTRASTASKVDSRVFKKLN